MDETEEMVRLLLSRAKMLGYHCPRCKLPLFERDKMVLCVRCGEVRVEMEEKKDAKEILGGEEKRKILEKKKEAFLKILESEKDPSKVVTLLEAISKIEESLKDL